MRLGHEATDPTRAVDTSSSTTIGEAKGVASPATSDGIHIVMLGWS